jgi:hypothetical protein
MCGDESWYLGERTSKIGKKKEKKWGEQREKERKGFRSSKLQSQESKAKGVRYLLTRGIYKGTKQKQYDIENEEVVMRNRKGSHFFFWTFVFVL